MCVVFLVNVDNLILMVSDCLNGKSSGPFFLICSENQTNKNKKHI